MEKAEEPRNRIKLVHSQTIASDDCKVLKEWADGTISDGVARAKIAKANHIDILSHDDFVENAHWLGYFRPWEKL